MAAAVHALLESLESEVPAVDAGLNESAVDARVAGLTGRMVEGEEAAWEEFHAEYFDRLRRYLLVLCRGEDQAAGEALQAVFVKVARHVRRFDREEAWWGWLAVVARSCVVDAARGRSRYAALLERYAGIFRPLPGPPPGEDLAGMLAECLDALPEGERALLVAKYVEGESTACLAERAECTAKAVESRLARLRGRLKEDLLRRLRHEK